MLSKELVAASTEPLILTLLSEGESYGYALIQEVKRLSSDMIEWPLNARGRGKQAADRMKQRICSLCCRASSMPIFANSSVVAWLYIY